MTQQIASAPQEMLKRPIGTLEEARAQKYSQFPLCLTGTISQILKYGFPTM